MSSSTACLTHGLPLTWANNIGSGEDARMRRLAWIFAVLICYDGSFSISRLMFFYAPPPPHHAIFNWGAYSITAVRTYVRPVRPVRNTNGFRAISFEKIGVFN